MSQTHVPSISPDSPDERAAMAREQAIKQIERRRRFQVEVVASTIGLILIVVVWATGEYQNSGGWPTGGFSQSSGLHHVWNMWIVYPVTTWALYLAARYWVVYRHEPVTEQEIDREIERQGRVS